MKRNLLMLAIVMAAGTCVAKAQIQKGNVLVGGDIANFDLGLNTGSRFSVKINPKATWFIKNNTVLGAYVNLGLSTTKGLGTTFLMVLEL